MHDHGHGMERRVNELRVSELRENVQMGQHEELELSALHEQLALGGLLVLDGQQVLERAFQCMLAFLRYMVLADRLLNKTNRFTIRISAE